MAIEKYGRMSQESVVKQWQGPKGICTCKHVGDGRWSQHEGHPEILQNGHGGCLEPGCECKKFTFEKWTGSFQSALRAAGVR
jgi:hypothetical protein